MKYNPTLYLVFSGFSLFFLISGGLALKRKRIKVVNPDSDAAWPGFAGMLMKSVRDQYGAGQMLKGPVLETEVELTGSDVLGMATLYLVLGTAFAAVAVFDFLMRNDLLAFLFD